MAPSFTTSGTRRQPPRFGFRQLLARPSPVPGTLLYVLLSPINRGGLPPGLIPCPPSGRTRGEPSPGLPTGGRRSPLTRLLSWKETRMMIKSKRRTGGWLNTTTQMDPVSYFFKEKFLVLILWWQHGKELQKFPRTDVYDGRGTLEEGETAEARFIKIQAAYELLIDEEKRRQYDKDHHVNPMKASQAWMEWLIKKRKAFDQRGEMAITTWAEQQQRELFLRARNRARTKIDPEEERKILAKEKKASAEIFSNTIKRHTLVLKKRDLMRRKSEEEKRKVIGQLLAAEGLELDTDNDDDDGH